MTDMVIVASYKVERRFRVPKGYTEEQLEELISKRKAIVKWDTLYITDGDKTIEIQAHQDDTEADECFKRPDDLNIEEAEDEDYDEEDCYNQVDEPRECDECHEDFTPSTDHKYDAVCDECVTDKGKHQSTMTLKEYAVAIQLSKTN
jgi:predicted metal-binding protein